MLNSLFRKRSMQALGDRLYAAAVAQARRADFYTALGVADRIDARFELYTLHVLLLILRLRDEPGGEGPEAAQNLFDVYVSSLDHALRELGVGDMSIARKMRNLGEALYGRMTAYETPLRDGDATVLAERLARNVHESDDVDRGAGLARYAIAARAVLAAQPYAAVIGAPSWPEIAA